jgi:GntR family transcriptional regulator, transcriptional repressor for pyruvate dehydrogenase complex
MASGQVSTEAAEKLRRQILDGVFPAGARLPAERALSVELGISRTALRDALQTLEAMGLLEAHVGRGWFVTDEQSIDRSVAAATSWLSLHRRDLESLNEVRELLEPRAVATMPKGGAATVAERARAIVERQAQALRRGELEVAARLDADFHATLVAETPNEPLRVLAGQLIALGRAPVVAVYGVPGAAEHSIAQHEEIVAALEGGDVRRAARLVRDHARTAARFALNHG